MHQQHDKDRQRGQAGDGSGDLGGHRGRERLTRWSGRPMTSAAGAVAAVVGVAVVEVAVSEVAAAEPLAIHMRLT
jgi:hypothetical protein